jgi:hypothetical protein
MRVKADAEPEGWPRGDKVLARAASPSLSGHEDTECVRQPSRASAVDDRVTIGGKRVIRQMAVRIDRDYVSLYSHAPATAATTSSTSPHTVPTTRILRGKRPVMKANRLA